MRRLPYSWVICAVCALVIFASIGMTLTTFSVYMPYFISVNHYTNSEASMLVTIRSLVAFFVMFGITSFYKKVGMRFGLTIAVLSGMVGFAILASSQNYLLACVATGFLGICYALGGMYPLTIIINQWFTKARALALSFSSSSSGMCSIICPTILTYVIETRSLSDTFKLVTFFFLIVSLITFIFIRNKPSAAPASAVTGTKTKIVSYLKRKDIPKKHFYLLMLSVTLNGALTVAGWAHFAVLFKTNGYDSMLVAFALSAAGTTLTISKFFYGIITSRLNTFKSNFLFFTCLNLGYLSTMFLPLGANWCPYAVGILTGLGCPVSSVAISMWATDVSSEEHFADNLRKLQTCHVFGSMAFNPLPGLVADLTGSYVPIFLVFSIFGLTSYALVQSIYLKNGLHKL